MKLTVAFNNFANEPKNMPKDTRFKYWRSESGVRECDFRNWYNEFLWIRKILNVWRFLRGRISDFEFRPRTFYRRNCVLNNIRPAFDTMCHCNKIMWKMLLQFVRAEFVLHTSTVLDLSGKYEKFLFLREIFLNNILLTKLIIWSVISWRYIPVDPLPSKIEKSMSHHAACLLCALVAK